MNAAELQDSGLLQEINRRLLHPLGLAMYVERDGQGRVTWGGVYDWSDDPEGVRFGDDVALAPAAEAFDALWAKRTRPRKAALGYVVQPTEAQA